MSKEKGVYYKPTSIGERFGRLIVIGDGGWHESPSGKSRVRLVRCKCDCGKDVTVVLQNLKSGRTKSCGCLQIENTIKSCRKYNTFEIVGEDCICHCENGDFICDAEDYDLIKDRFWAISKEEYAFTNTKGNGRVVRAHRLIMKCENGEIIDHIDGDRANNKKSNLRVCDATQNSQNRKVTSFNKSGKIGVSYNKRDDRYVAYIQIKGKMKYLGQYRNIEDAITARITAEEKYFGEFAPKYDK